MSRRCIRKGEMMIYIDIDGVVADTHGLACDIAGGIWGIDVTPAQITSWNPGIGGIEMGTVIEKVANDPRLNKYIKPVEDAVYYIEEILVDYDAKLLTARPAMSKTDMWVAEHFGWPVEVIYCADKAQCADPGDILIDDDPSQCRAWQQAGGRALLFDQPWNRDAEGLTRCVGWGEVLQELGL